MDWFRLDSKVAVITGGSRGIGLAIAEGMAQAGAHVVLVARGADMLTEAVNRICASGGSAEGIVLDVQDIAAGQQMIADVIARRGRLDILVNNAGMNIRTATLEVTPDDFDRILAVNLRGPFFLCQAAAKHMVSAQTGKIINIASLSSFVGLRKIASYASSKGALVQMTRTMSAEWARDNVQVNAIAPGFIRTDLNRKLWENEAVLNWVIGNTPAGRLGTPEDIVGAALFLASPASNFVTGHVLAVDGGFLSGGTWPL
ncbi:MAG: glucose 1-dehydrogenase [Chloroflexi bacterium]|nr:glucose 1-dehydrogenase [Chloroflexota bacterium]